MRLLLVGYCKKLWRHGGVHSCIGSDGWPVVWITEPRHETASGVRRCDRSREVVQAAPGGVTLFVPPAFAALHLAGGVRGLLHRLLYEELMNRLQLDATSHTDTVLHHHVV